MANMFSHAYAFDSDLSGWDLFGVTTMYAMFAGAKSFDSDLSGWDVLGITDMADMFRSTGAFNSDISRWPNGTITVPFDPYGRRSGAIRTQSSSSYNFK